MPVVRYFADYRQSEKLLLRGLQELETGLSDFRRQSERVYREFWVPKMRRQFESEGADSGGKWNELTAAYARYKRKRYGFKTILRRTDRFYRSLVSETGDTAKIIDQNTATFGSCVPYGEYAQRSRPVITLTGKDLTELGNFYVREMKIIVREGGF